MRFAAIQSFENESMHLNAQAISALASADQHAADHDETIFRRTAADVMITAIKALMADTGASAPNITRRLKQLAVEFDQPVKIELMFDVIAALDKDETSNVVWFR
jgi:hypothetical protein